jgi:O-methyltransferase involved in polyketide biosynthesis
MSSIRNVTGTAFVVAEFRAEEKREANPLYQDPIVDWFLNEETGKRPTCFYQFSTGHGSRPDTNQIHDVFEKQLHADVRQVVILGAGLDTRAVRKPFPA